MSNQFRDDLKNRAETDSCLVCRKPTRSHVVLLTYDPDTDAVAATDTLDAAAGFGVVCHTCYRDESGDADAVTAAYTDYLRRVLSHPDTPDVTVREFVNQPMELDIPDTIDD